MNNQTELHYELTRKTERWLSYKTTGRGLIWKQEFSLLNGIRPDAVAFCDLQEKYFEFFTKVIVNWNLLRSKKQFICKEFISKIAKDNNERKQVIQQRISKIDKLENEFGVPENRFMFIFETKVSLPDYKNTFELDNHTVSKLKSFANFHFLVVPKNFIKENLITEPQMYGILEESGKGLKLVKSPPYFCMEELNFYKNAYNMLFRNKFKTI